MNTRMLVVFCLLGSLVLAAMHYDRQNSVESGVEADRARETRLHKAKVEGLAALPYEKIPLKYHGGVNENLKRQLGYSEPEIDSMSINEVIDSLNGRRDGRPMYQFGQTIRVTRVDAARRFMREFNEKLRQEAEKN